MNTNTITISDSDFIDEYRSLNAFHRVIICETCLKSFDDGNEEIKRSIGVEITNQYVGLLEDLAMIFFALKNRDKYDGSCVMALSKIFIKEEKGKYSSEKLVNEVSELLLLSFDDILSQLHLPTFEKIQSQLISKAGEGEEDLRAMYEREMRDILQTLSLLVNNRISGKTGDTFQFSSISNKIKHGSFFLLIHKSDDAVFYPLSVKVDTIKNENIIEGYFLVSSNKKSLEKMVVNMKQIGHLIATLLTIYQQSL